MSLRDRLGRLTGDAAKPFQADLKQDRVSELRNKISEIMNRRERLGAHPPPPLKDRPVSLESVVTGEEAVTPQGRFFFSRGRLKAADFHGHARVCDLVSPSMDAVAFLAGADVPKGLSMEDALFLDTETTGLAGGTGTFPFLIGLGWFEDGGFITHQLFARDFSEEPAMLACLCELASKRKFLVTFNGKAYDLNLLATRFILNRFRDMLSGMPQIDLLHPSRRIYSHRLENVRLATLESSVLGVRREQDVPGHEIPQRYFDWLRRRDGRLMADVFRHNRLDIISMASLLKHVTDLVAGGPAAYSHHADLLSVARLHHDRGDLAAAIRIFEPLSRSGQPGVAQGARRSLSLIHKKTNQWHDAVSLWQEMIALDPYDVFAAEELAKWYEHHVREFSLAAEIVARILDGERLSEPDRPAMEHRLRRLRYKVGS
ncbi:MAG: ribonuclease H-like domain-containing protein [Deltaproteobacteria bacterium]|nr:ribonuclease H-like domain-containing protein [Deltaproteobacteria bacterium]